MHRAPSPRAVEPTTRHHRTASSGPGLRRRLLAALVSIPLLFGAAACGDDGGDSSSAADPNAKVELSIFWWGAEARAKLTEDALALYTTKHPNVTFKKTWQANQGYFD